MRLVTRSDFDGLVCAVLLKKKDIIDEYKFVHPKDVQDGKVEVTQNDVLANVPYVEGCGMWFDHHSSEDERLKNNSLDYQGRSRPAKSAAQVIWDYYGGQAAFGTDLLPLLEAVNKTDSGNLTKEEILYPEGWILLSFIMDARTGLGRFRDYQISNYELMMDMVDYCGRLTAEQIIIKDDIQERVIRYFYQQEMFIEMIQDCSEIKGNVIISNLLDQETIYSGNRFIVYALYPEQNVDVRLMWGKGRQNVVFAVGYSVLNRTCQTDIGTLMLKHGGGGHKMVGTCQVSADRWRETAEDIVAALRDNG